MHPPKANTPANGADQSHPESDEIPIHNLSDYARECVQADSTASGVELWTTPRPWCRKTRGWGHAPRNPTAESRQGEAPFRPASNRWIRRKTASGWPSTSIRSLSRIMNRPPVRPDCWSGSRRRLRLQRRDQGQSLGEIRSDTRADWPERASCRGCSHSSSGYGHGPTNGPRSPRSSGTSPKQARG